MQRVGAGLYARHRPVYTRTGREEEGAQARTGTKRGPAAGSHEGPGPLLSRPPPPDPRGPLPSPPRPPVPPDSGRANLCSRFDESEIDARIRLARLGGYSVYPPKDVTERET